MLLILGLKNLGGDRSDFVLDSIETPVNKILDVGCSFGWTLAKLQDKSKALYGIDMHEEALKQAAVNYPYLNLVHQTAATLPYPSEEFDVVVLSDVIEHVGDENKQLVINESYRVLKKGGLFIFTAPYQGAFAWADPMDFKRRFSRIYRFYMKISGYVPSDPVELGHKHVSFTEVQNLLGERFTLSKVQYCGLFMPFFTWILAIDSRMHLLPQRIHQNLNRFRAWESGISYPKFLAFNIRLTAIKK